MGFLTYRVEWLLLLTAIIVSGTSIFFDLQSTQSTLWFARSGSIVVLLSIVVEFRLSSYIHEDVFLAAKKTAMKKVVKISDNPIVQGGIEAKQTIKPETPISRKILQYCSHVLVITGTVIWGYGDLWAN